MSQERENRRKGAYKAAATRRRNKGLPPKEKPPVNLSALRLPNRQALQPQPAPLTLDQLFNLVTEASREKVQKAGHKTPYGVALQLIQNLRWLADDMEDHLDLLAIPGFEELAPDHIRSLEVQAHQLAVNGYRIAAFARKMRGLDETPNIVEKPKSLKELLKPKAQ